MGKVVVCQGPGKSKSKYRFHYTDAEVKRWKESQINAAESEGWLTAAQQSNSMWKRRTEEDGGE